MAKILFYKQSQKRTSPAEYFDGPYKVVFSCCCHSDEDVEDSLDWLPMAPEIEDPEEPGWGQLEVRGE